LPSCELGRYLILSQFISPALYQKYPGAVDEWTLSQAMAQDTASGGLNQLEDHYKTFIVCPIWSQLLCNAYGKTQTEQDFAQIAGAGLNYVRIPLPYWAIETRNGEPFLAKTSWKYVLTCRGISLILIVPQVFSHGY
jgi:glucan 1,3-beta-glucosidase